jgi:hypothetical protein
MAINHPYNLAANEKVLQLGWSMLSYWVGATAVISFSVFGIEWLAYVGAVGAGILSFDVFSESNPLESYLPGLLLGS